MNKPDDPNKRGDIVPVDPPKLPAIRKTPNKWKQFTLLERYADGIQEEYSALCELRYQLWRRQPGEQPPDLHDGQLSGYAAETELPRCRELLKQIDTEDLYEEADDDDDERAPILKKKVISKRLAMTLGAVHVGGPKTPEAFVEILLAHVYDEQVSYVVLESACREIERTEKFVQTTSEILKVIKEHRAVWWERRNAIRDIERVSRDVQQLICNAQQKYQREAAERASAEAVQKLSEGGRSLSYAIDMAIQKQQAAREAYQAVERAMGSIAEREEKFEQARVELNRASERVKQLQHEREGDA